eukprot:scaffold102563_cov47-Prasinocladus_malaysianus.AAC.2
MFQSQGPILPDLFEPVGKLKVDNDVDELTRKLTELKARFREVNFDAVLVSADELRQAGVTDTTTRGADTNPKFKATIQASCPSNLTVAIIYPSRYLKLPPN